ncbi:hypothetical protein B8W95_13790, partial [Staphylococcus pasteuri]
MAPGGRGGHVYDHEFASETERDRRSGVVVVVLVVVIAKSDEVQVGGDVFEHLEGRDLSACAAAAGSRDPVA